jgi:hypothetical protein
VEELIRRALLLLLELPGAEPSYPKPISATNVKYIEFLEDNTHIIYPLLAIAVVALVSYAVIIAVRSTSMDLVLKAEIKRAVVQTMRREIHGVTVEMLSRLVGVPSFRLHKILEEMRKDGILEPRTDTHRITTWHLKGLLG